MDDAEYIYSMNVLQSFGNVLNRLRVKQPWRWMTMREAIMRFYVPV